ncbi:MAG: RNA 2',3'-cyclic phosphodiesterase [Parvibaculaceae bacterium]
MPRLFTGIEIPPDIAADLDLMKGGVWGARWIEPENFHLTLRFVGDVDENVSSELALMLQGVSPPAFTMQLRGVGAFGGAKPHTIYTGVPENPALRRLQAAQERICQAVGLPPEQRKYTPHVTLARLRQANAGEVQRFIAAHNLYASRPFEVTSFVLFSSRPSRGGGPYAVVERFDLRRQEPDLSSRAAAGR